MRSDLHERKKKRIQLTRCNFTRLVWSFLEQVVHHDLIPVVLGYTAVHHLELTRVLLEAEGASKDSCGIAAHKNELFLTDGLTSWIRVFDKHTGCFLRSFIALTGEDDQLMNDLAILSRDRIAVM